MQKLKKHSADAPQYAVQRVLTCSFIQLVIDAWHTVAHLHHWNTQQPHCTFRQLQQTELQQAHAEAAAVLHTHLWLLRCSSSPHTHDPLGSMHSNSVCLVSEHA